jgi:hypothetical protein
LTLLEQVRGLEAAARLAKRAARVADDRTAREYHRGAGQAYATAASHLRRRFGL